MYKKPPMPQYKKKNEYALIPNEWDMTNRKSETTSAS